MEKNQSLNYYETEIKLLLDDYDEKYMKTKFNLDDELPLNKTIEISSMIIVVSCFSWK